MRANYRIPKWVKQNVENELRQYYNNLEILEEEENDILEGSPPPPDGQPKGNGVGNPTEAKTLRLNTRALLLTRRRLNSITRVKESLPKEDEVLFNLMYKDGFNARLAYTYKGISEDTFYSVKKKIQYLVAVELGYI